MEIKGVVFDIDGVLTNGYIYIDCNGNEMKAVRLTEIDSISEIKKMGFLLGAVTGENTPITTVFRNSVGWDYFETGCKNKVDGIKRMARQFGLKPNEICYIGDGKYDVPAIQYAGLGVCPSNAIQEVKDIADIVLSGAGGESCIYELYQLLKKEVAKSNERTDG